MALVLEGGYDLVALEAGLAERHRRDARGPSAEPIAPSDDEGVSPRGRWAQKAWSDVD